MYLFIEKTSLPVVFPLCHNHVTGARDTPLSKPGGRLDCHARAVIDCGENMAHRESTNDKERPGEDTGLEVLKPRKKVGLVVVLTGPGKGKTTSALGMALRAAGHGMRVAIIHFVKGDKYAGEQDAVKRLGPNVELYLTGKGFCGIQGNTLPDEEHRANAQAALELAAEKITSGLYDMVVLDEINNALKLKLADLPQVLRLIDVKPPDMHLILTGRDAHEEVIARAHTVSEVREIKHAYRQDIEPQMGVDY
jgi:cob(I)alamin adenosyltransferase